MRRKILAVLLLVTILVSLAFVVKLGILSEVYASGSINATLELENFTWSHSTLRVLIITVQNASWWDSSYTDSVLRAVGVWNDGFQSFAQNYSDYSYMSRFTLNALVSNVSSPGFDIYLSWVEDAISKQDEVGLSVTYSVSQSATNSTISLSTHTAIGVTLSAIDMQNLAVHEIGHSIGLGHSNYSDDIMYSSSILSSPAHGVSSLDVYGVAATLGWMANSTQPNNNDQWPLVSSVSSPSDVIYIIYKSSNLPDYSVLEPVVGPLRVLLQITLMYIPLNMLILIIVMIILLAVVWELYKHRKSCSAEEETKKP
jgi:predicted Zn-dependent protease